MKTDKLKIFTQRPISAEVNGIKLSGIVDFVLAEGIAAPQRPYLFLHEYKQERKSSNDPIAQLLAEMLAAQSINKDKKNIYGSYIMGRFWFFIVLNEAGEFAVSDAYTATQEIDVLSIVAILRKSLTYF